MATVKIKFRPSMLEGGQGTIFYQVIHNRVARQQNTGYRLYGYEWNSHLSEVIILKSNEERKHYLSEISNKIRTSETYAAALRSFRRFRDDKDLVLDDMNSDMMMA